MLKMGDRMVGEGLLENVEDVALCQGAEPWQGWGEEW